MKLIEICDTQNQPIKHLRPSNHRKLKRMLRDFSAYILKDKELTIHLHYFNGEELMADVYEHNFNSIDYLESIQSFAG